MRYSETCNTELDLQENLNALCGGWRHATDVVEHSRKHGRDRFSPIGNSIDGVKVNRAGRKARQLAIQFARHLVERVKFVSKILSWSQQQPLDGQKEIGRRQRKVALSILDCTKKYMYQGAEFEGRLK